MRIYLRLEDDPDRLSIADDTDRDPDDELDGQVGGRPTEPRAPLPPTAHMQKIDQIVQ